MIVVSKTALVIVIAAALIIGAIIGAVGLVIIMRLWMEKNASSEKLKQLDEASKDIYDDIREKDRE